MTKTTTSRLILVFMIVLLCLSIFVPMTDAQTYTINSTGIDANSLSFNTQRKITKNSFGEVFVVHIRTNAGGTQSLWVDKSADGGITWSTHYNITSSNKGGMESCAIASLSNSNLFVVYNDYPLDNSTTGYKYCYYVRFTYSNSTWDRPHRFDSVSSPHSTRYPNLAVTSSDDIYFTWIQDVANNTGEVYVARFTPPGTLVSENQITTRGYNQVAPSIVANRSVTNKVYIAWSGGLTSSVGKSRIQFVVWSNAGGATWNIPSYSLPAGDELIFSQFVVYKTPTGSNTTELVSYDAVSGKIYSQKGVISVGDVVTWSTEVEVFTTGYYSSIGVNKTGVLYIISDNFVSHVIYCKYSTDYGTTWSTYSLPSSMTSYGYPSLLYSMLPYNYNQFSQPVFVIVNSTSLQYFSPLGVSAPGDPSSLNVLSTGTTTAHLRWVNPFFTGILQAVCRYSTSGYPTTPTSGTSGFNITTTSNSFAHYNITGLTPAKKYYFSLWSCAQIITEGFLYSSSYTTATGTTLGGQYNITFKLENSSYHNAITSKSGNHTLIVYYQNFTEINTFNLTDGALFGHRFTQSPGDFNKTRKGYVTLDLTYTPKYFEFRYNKTVNYTNTKYCIRQLVNTGAKNYTFYVLRNKLTYGESSAYTNNSLVKYQISLLDRSGAMKLPPPSPFSIYAYFYSFDSSGNRHVIHSEYLNSESKVYPEFLYANQYYVGVFNNSYNFDGFSRFTASDELTPQIQVTGTNTTSSIDPIIKSGWIDSTGGLWTYYFDQNSKTLSSWLRFYDYNNNTAGNLLYGVSSFSQTFNLSYFAANHSRNYLIVLLANGTNGDQFQYNMTMYQNYSSIRRFNGSHINAFMNMTFGHSPFRDVNNPNTYVPWIDVVVAFIGFFLICSFPGESANLAALVTGGFFVFGGAFISGIYPVTVTLGILFIFFGILYSWRNKK